MSAISDPELMEGTLQRNGVVCRPFISIEVTKKFPKSDKLSVGVILTVND